MYCSNCGAQLPENGVCAHCGVPATNMTFTGHLQGKPVVPQQSFYNPNPMYVQYQGSNQGLGQSYGIQQNVAIKGEKDPKIVAGVGAIIKDSSASMMMLMVALLTTAAMIFSYIELFNYAGVEYYMDGYLASANVLSVFVKCIPFTLFAIGAWMIVFYGHGTYDSRLYNDRACMNTAGFSTVQAGGIFMLVVTVIDLYFALFLLLTSMIVAMGVSVGVDEANVALFVFLYITIVTALIVTTIIVAATIISQMSKIKHAIRGRNYESISLILPVVLFIMASLHVILLVQSAWYKDVFGTLSSGVYALWYALVACAFLYIRNRANSYILQCR
ncbi:MAG: hypothetical protein IJY81_03120 [Lachnospiraceae bacterium]|nr:hypothetical protein [Lachnospiraceae bacterium]